MQGNSDTPTVQLFTAPHHYILFLVQKHASRYIVI